MPDWTHGPSHHRRHRRRRSAHEQPARAAGRDAARPAGPDGDGVRRTPQDRAAHRRDRCGHHRGDGPRRVPRGVQDDPSRASVPRFDGDSRADALSGDRRSVGRRRLGTLDRRRPVGRRGAQATQGSPRLRRAEGEDLPCSARQAVRVHRRRVARGRGRLRYRGFLPQRRRHRLARIAHQGARTQEGHEGRGEGEGEA